MDASLPVEVTPVASAHRPRLTSPERRQAIIEAALSLFSEKGFRGVTTRELASAVGVTEPVLYQHFKTKSDLFRALVESQCQLPETEMELQPYIEAGDDAAFFRHLGMGILTWYLDDTRFPKLLLHSALDRHELAHLFYETQVSRFYQMIEAHIAARIRAGAFRDIDPTLAARAFVGMVGHQGMIGAVYAPDKAVPPRQEMVEQLVNIFLSGLKSDKQTDQKEEKE